MIFQKFSPGISLVGVLKDCDVRPGFKLVLQKKQRSHVAGGVGEMLENMGTRARRRMRFEVSVVRYRKRGSSRQIGVLKPSYGLMSRSLWLQQRLPGVGEESQGRWGGTWTPAAQGAWTLFHGPWGAP